MARKFTHENSPRSGGRAVWISVALLASVGAGLLFQLGPGAPAAVGQGPAAYGARKLLAVPGQIARDMHGLYLIDQETATICVYQYVPASGKLRLLASRKAAFDLELEDYNTEPSPRAIRDLVEEQSRLQGPASLIRPGEGEE